MDVSRTNTEINEIDERWAIRLLEGIDQNLATQLDKELEKDIMINRIQHEKHKVQRVSMSRRTEIEEVDESWAVKLLEELEKEDLN
jgi:hypothetical protein